VTKFIFSRIHTCTPHLRWPRDMSIRTTHVCTGAVSVGLDARAEDEFKGCSSCFPFTQERTDTHNKETGREGEEAQRVGERDSSVCLDLHPRIYGYKIHLFSVNASSDCQLCARA
jgi:hypothetical protein